MIGQRIAWQMLDGSIIIGKSFIDDHEAFARKVQNDPEMAGAQRLPNLTADDKVDIQWFQCLRADKSGKFSVDMPLARAQRLEEIRVERDRRLGELDGPWMRAMGQGKTDEATTIEAKRQALRDIPQTIVLEAITTPEELEAFEPEWEPAAK